MQAVSLETVALEADTGAAAAATEVSSGEECSNSYEQDHQEDVDAHHSIDCFNCHHTVQLPPPPFSPPTVTCDNCGLPLPLPSTSPAEPDTASDQSLTADKSSDADSLHLLLDDCGVCGDLLTLGPLCFLACGHVIDDRHRLVYRHCAQCKPHLPPYSEADRKHQPSEQEAAHYRRRKEAERERYGEEKGPCFTLFIEPTEVARLLVYGEEEGEENEEEAAKHQSGASREAAMRRKVVDMQREVSEKQVELSQQAASEADKRVSIKRRREVLSERRESLARRKERTAYKQRVVEDRKLNVYAIGRECNRVERDAANIATHITQHHDRDREAVRAEDRAAFGALTASEDAGDDNSGGQPHEADSEQRKVSRPLLESGDAEATQSQVLAMHARYTHLHNSRIRQMARNKKEQDALSKQQSAIEAAIEAVRRECSEWADQLSTLQREVTALQRRRGATQQRTAAQATDDTNRAATTSRDVPRSTEPIKHAAVAAKSRLNPPRVIRSSGSSEHNEPETLDALTSSHLSSALSAPHLSSASSRPLPLSCRSPVIPSVPSSGLSSRSSLPRPAVSVPVPASLSSRRFPSFSALPSVSVDRRLSGADGKGGRVLFAASGVAVPAMSSGGAATTVKVHAALSDKRGAAEANKGALDRFVHAVKR